MSKLTLDEAIKHCLEVAEQNEFETRIYDELNRQGDEEYRNNHCQCAADHRQLAEWLTELKEAKRLLQAAEKTIDEYCRGFCECCKNRDFELARCGLVNGCRDNDNWEWILSYRVKELFKED